ncbi:MAG: DNA ligase (NAD(+)) LigA, partial [Bacteroidota bacterium]
MRYDKAQQKALFERSKALLNEANATTESTAKPQAADLREVIVYHEYRYYVLNEPLVSDFEYDQLYKKLEAIEAQFTNLLVPDSPTQRVSNDITDDFPTVQHLVPMLSLDNSYNLEDLMDFDRRIKDKANLPEDLEIEYVVEPKFDGGSISLIYENDLLVRAATRGNGKEGDEITNNAKRVRSVPLKAEFSRFGLHRVELRGEVIIPRDVFEKVNATREKNGQSILANPRNAATGAMRVKESAEVERRGLDAFLYQLGYAENEAGDNILESLKRHESGIQMLEQIGFKVPRLNIERKVCKNIQEAYEFCDAWQNKRDSDNPEIDGRLVKVNDFELQEKVGYTSHHPRWAISYKFKARQAT